MQNQLPPWAFMTSLILNTHTAERLGRHVEEATRQFEEVQADRLDLGIPPATEPEPYGRSLYVLVWASHRDQALADECTRLGAHDSAHDFVLSSLDYARKAGVEAARRGHSL